MVDERLDLLGRRKPLPVYAHNVDVPERRHADRHHHAAIPEPVLRTVLRHAVRIDCRVVPEELRERVLRPTLKILRVKYLRTGRIRVLLHLSGEHCITHAETHRLKLGQRKTRRKERCPVVVDRLLDVNRNLVLVVLVLRVCRVDHPRVRIPDVPSREHVCDAENHLKIRFQPRIREAPHRFLVATVPLEERLVPVLMHRVHRLDRPDVAFAHEVVEENLREVPARRFRLIRGKRERRFLPPALALQSQLVLRPLRGGRNGFVVLPYNVWKQPTEQDIRFEMTSDFATDLHRPVICAVLDEDRFLGASKHHLNRPRHGRQRSLKSAARPCVERHLDRLARVVGRPSVQAPAHPKMKVLRHFGVAENFLREKPDVRAAHMPHPTSP